MTVAMLFDTSALRCLPEKTLVFASGANNAWEIPTHRPS